MSAQLATQRRVLLGQTRVSVHPTPMSYPSQRSTESVLRRLALDYSSPLPGTPPIVGEPQHREAALALRAAPRRLRRSAKLHHPRLVRMQAKTVLLQPLRQHPKHPPRIVFPAAPRSHASEPRRRTSVSAPIRWRLASRAGGRPPVVHVGLRFANRPAELRSIPVGSGRSEPQPGITPRSRRPRCVTCAASSIRRARRASSPRAARAASASAAPSASRTNAPAASRGPRR